MEEIKVTFDTITPIWTGDAYGDCKDIKAQSILGALRFWFEIYCKSCGIKTDSGNNEKFDYKAFKKKIDNNIKDPYELSVFQENPLKNNSLSLPAKIFGCTGWKSRLSIKDLSGKPIKIAKKDIDFKYLYNHMKTQTKSSYFWSNKLFFKDKDEVQVFENISFKLLCESIYLEDLKKFFKFYEDRIVMAGGKNSFGFGFIKFKTNLDLKDVKPPDASRCLFQVKKINIVKTQKKILGFNFKHYQRLMEPNKKFRHKNFGKMSNSSKIYYSLKNKNSDSIFIFTFDEAGNSKFLIQKYSKFPKRR